VAGRERNPVRSRERILAAALEEFAAHGFAGARVEAIAQRAGLNKQLISHHFGGKEALYLAVMAARRAQPGGELRDEPEALPEALAAMFDRAAHDPSWIRVLLWEALEDESRPAADADDRERRARYRRRARWVKREQAAGRLPAGIDADLLYLSLVGAAVYPLLLPRVCELVTGRRPDDPAFARRQRRHLTRLAAALGVDG